MRAHVLPDLHHDASTSILFGVQQVRERGRKAETIRRLIADQLDSAIDIFVSFPLKFEAVKLGRSVQSEGRGGGLGGRRLFSPLDCVAFRVQFSRPVKLYHYRLKKVRKLALLQRGSIVGTWSESQVRVGIQLGRISFVVVQEIALDPDAECGDLASIEVKRVLLKWAIRHLPRLILGRVGYEDAQGPSILLPSAPTPHQRRQT